MKRADSAGKTHKRRELMADGRRYIIYYTFDQTEKSTTESVKNEAEKNV
ncbi:hypothetical protein BH18ACI1_BH18ACI1_00510 [soil metagenome]